MCGGSVQMEVLVQHVGAPRTQQRTEGQCVERVRREAGGGELAKAAGERKREEELAARGARWPRWCSRAEAMGGEQPGDVLGGGCGLHPAHIAIAAGTSLKVGLENVSQKP